VNREAELDRTALARIPNLRLETIPPYPGSSGRDRTLTEEWLAWMDRRDPSCPFFGFLFYNAAVATTPPKDYPAAVPVPVKASIQGQLHARYLTAVHFVDSLIRWPGRPPGRIARRTSHFDMAPTLLSGVFGCTNPPSDYPSGQDLFDGRPWDWLIAANHHSFALVEPDRVTIVSPTRYEIRDGNYRLVHNMALPRDRLCAACREMRRFYRP
jgi:membrane-anchored protein YejM (alkaline phosphatase superfamily)